MFSNVPMQTCFRHNVDRAVEQLLHCNLETTQINQTTPRFEIDENVYITARLSLITNGRTEYPYLTNSIPLGDS